MPTIQDVNPEILRIARMFDKPYAYAAAMVALYEVQLPLPPIRYADDGLNGFYSDMTGSYNEEPSLTKQEFTETCDPNFIIDRVRRGQDVSAFMSVRTPQYGDFTNAPDSYHQALSFVTEAKQSFMQLDPEIRSKFDNDPGKFLDYVNNPDNAQALIDMGLAVAKPQDTSPAAASSPAAVETGGGEGA